MIHMLVLKTTAIVIRCWNTIWAWSAQVSTHAVSLPNTVLLHKGNLPFSRHQHVKNHRSSDTSSAVQDQTTAVILSGGGILVDLGFRHAGTP
ncbi:hypothetical protein, partial [Roseinatronobacter monicus]|uniref:hypothetical protein n=1 Tax=Roseinatronobacter monicus TaxID=393481 RepID=UPI003F2CB4D5